MKFKDYSRTISGLFNNLSNKFKGLLYQIKLKNLIGVKNRASSLGFWEPYVLLKNAQKSSLIFYFLRWLPPVLHFPEPLNFTKGFLAHYDRLVPVLARWCYNSF